MLDIEYRAINTGFAKFEFAGVFKTNFIGAWGKFVTEERKMCSPLLLMFQVDGHCVLLDLVGWLCLLLDFPPSVAELFRLLPLKSGTLPEHIVSAPTLQSFSRHLKTFLL